MNPSSFGIARAIAALFLLGLFNASLFGFVESWYAFREYGFLAGGYVLFDVWRRRDTLKNAHAVVRASVLLLGGIGTISWLFAEIMSVQVVALAAFLLVAGSWVSGMFGVTGAELVRRHAPLLVVITPVWEILLSPLQSMTVWANTALIRMTGLAAIVDGTSIRFPFGTLVVAESCAGLNYFMTALTISIIYALEFLDSRRQRVIAVALACTMAILANWIRVFGLVVIGHETRMQSSLMSSHGTYGWLIFAVTMLAYFAIVQRHRAFSVARDVGVMTNATEGHKPVAGIPMSRPVVTATLIMASGPLVFFGVRLFKDLPLAASEPIGLAVRAGAWTRQAVVDNGPARSVDHAQIVWRLPAGAELRSAVVPREVGPPIDVTRLLLFAQAQGNELVGGRSLHSDSVVVMSRIVGPIDRDFRVVRETAFRTATGFRLAWSWFVVANTATPIASKAKLLEIRQFFAGTHPAELVMVSAPCAGDDCADARAGIQWVVTGSRPEPVTAP